MLMILTMKRIIVLSSDTKRIFGLGLCVIYPLGLNDRVQCTGSVSQGIVSGNESFANPIRRRPQGHGCHKRGTAPRVGISDIIDGLVCFYDGKRFHDLCCFEIMFQAFLRSYSM